MAKKFVLLGSVFFCLLSPLVLAGSSPISIRQSRVVPKSKTANVVIEVTIEKDSSNREVLIGCDSAENYRASSQTIEGEKMARVTLFEMYLTPGQYVCQGELRRSNRSEPLTSTRLNVVILY